MMDLFSFVMAHPSQVVAIFVIVYLIFGIGFTTGLCLVDHGHPKRYSMEWWAMGLVTILVWPYAMICIMRM